jgi:hypothetical protein
VYVCNRTVQPERQPAFARPSGTTTSATAPAAKQNTSTDSSTASNRCKCSSSDPRSLHDSDPTSNQLHSSLKKIKIFFINIKFKKKKKKISVKTQFSYIQYKKYKRIDTVRFGLLFGHPYSRSRGFGLLPQMLRQQSEKILGDFDSLHSAKILLYCSRDKRVYSIC